MPTFRFESIASGLSPGQASVIDAPDRAAAVRILRQRGITPVAIEPVAGGNGLAAIVASAPKTEPAKAKTESKAEPSNAAGGRSAGGGVGGLALTAAMSKSEMASFVRELATAIGAGLTLVQAMKTIARQGHSERQKRMLAFLIDQVEHGRSFSDAAASWGKPFTELTTSLIRAGEASGKLPEVLDQSATLLDKDMKLRQSIVGALTYPMILLVLVAGAIIVVVTVIVPQILGALGGQMKFSDLPLPTRILSGIATFFGQWWWAVLGVMIVSALMWPRVYRRPPVRLSVDSALLRAPVLGRLLRDVAVARFTRTLGTLVSAGLPALTALRTTKGTLGNKAMEQVIDGVCDQVASGKTISEPLESAGVFPPLLVQIVSVGERSGRLPQLLSQAADAMENRTETAIKMFTTVLQPLLVVLLAGVVGFVVLSILLPLMQMQDHIK